MIKLINKFKDHLKTHLVNILGWQAPYKIIVFESDDWGTIRTSSKKALRDLEKEGVIIRDCHYMLNDSLETKNDLESLYSVLLSHVNKNSNPVKFTANCLMANPDFMAIKKSNYQEYIYEKCQYTFQRINKGDNIIEYWLKGNELGVFRPQFHGREHLNVSRWMAALQSKDPITRLAFRHGMFGVSGHILPERRGSYLAAYDKGDERYPIDQSEIVRDGLRIFRENIGYESTTFIAPNYVWNNAIENVAIQENVQAFQGSAAQRLPIYPGQKAKIIRHYQGQKKNNGLRYLVRNAQFEPSSDPSKDWVDSCLSEIKIAFRMKKPAIIGTHRVNYVGGLNKENRDRGLKELNKLLFAIVKYWPDVEFMSSDQLLQLIKGDRKT